MFINTKYSFMLKNKFLGFLLLTGVLLGFTPNKNLVLKNNSGDITLECETDYGVIRGTNHKVKSAYDHSSGKIQFSVLVNDLYFEKAIIQEEFNNYIVKSGQFPLATFNGVIENNTLIDLTRKGIYSTTISGNLSLKGVTKRITTSGSFIVTDKKATGVATFYAKPQDFNIMIPDYLKDEISEKIKINISIEYSLVE
jgi:hypothetical protein